jgi:hypothetical protein
MENLGIDGDIIKIYITLIERFCCAFKIGKGVVPCRDFSELPAACRGGEFINNL